MVVTEDYTLLVIASRQSTIGIWLLGCLVVTWSKCQTKNAKKSRFIPRSCRHRDFYSLGVLGSWHFPWKGKPAEISQRKKRQPAQAAWNGFGSILTNKGSGSHPSSHTILIIYGIPGARGTKYWPAGFNHKWCYLRTIQFWVWTLRNGYTSS